MFEKYEALQYW